MIKVENVSKIYKKDINVLNNINFEIADGEIVALLGHNGSGKSTLMKCMTGVIKPTSGKVLIDDIDVFKYQRKMIKNMGVVFNQKPSFIVDLSVKDNLLFFKTIYDINDEQYEDMIDTIDGYIDIRSLYDKQYRKLSFGERVKCEITSVMLHKPKYLFLDEPTIGLDYNAKEGLYALLRDYNKKYNASIIIITHEVDYIQSVCNHALIISEGNITYNNSCDILNEQLHQQGKTLSIKYEYIKDKIKMKKLMEKYNGKKINNQTISFNVYSEDDKNNILNSCIECMSVLEIKLENISLREVLEDVLQENKKSC